MFQTIINLFLFENLNRHQHFKSIKLELSIISIFFSIFITD